MKELSPFWSPLTFVRCFSIPWLFNSPPSIDPAPLATLCPTTCIAFCPSHHLNLKSPGTSPVSLGFMGALSDSPPHLGLFFHQPPSLPTGQGGPERESFAHMPVTRFSLIPSLYDSAVSLHAGRFHQVLSLKQSQLILEHKKKKK